MTLRITGGVSKNQVAEKLAAADIFLNTSRADNTPVSVIEAMACGLCIVSTNVGGIPFLLQHERNALLVNENDPSAMAAAVRRILTNADLSERLSRNARRDAEQFDWSAIVPQWDALLHTVAQFGASRPIVPGASFASPPKINTPAVSAEFQSHRNRSHYMIASAETIPRSAHTVSDFSGCRLPQRGKAYSLVPRFASGSGYGGF